MRISSILLTSILLVVMATAIVPLSAAVTWSEEFKLSPFMCFDGLPCIAQIDDCAIWVAWQSDILGNSDVLYRIFNESSWTDLYLLTDDTDNDISPCMFQAENGAIWVFWSSDRTGNYDIFYKTSLDGGSSWSDGTQLTTDSNNDNAPSAIQAANGTIWVVWQRRFPGPSGPTYDIFCRTYNGSSWSNEMPLITDPGLDEMPSIVQMADDRIWVAWCSNRTGDFEIFYKVYDGTSWADETQQLTTTSDMDVDPSLAQAADGTVWVVWTSCHPTGGATDDLYYKTSSDNGVNWSERIQLTTDKDQDSWASIALISGKGVCVVWTSDRYEDYNIFYKVSWVSDVAVTDVSPSRTAAAQGNNIIITVDVENEGAVSETFKVTAYCNTSAVQTQTVRDLNPNSITTLTFTWDTTKFPPANYAISVNATQVFGESDLSDNSQTDGIVQVKIPGDVDGDKDVDIGDLSLIARALGTDPTWPHGTGWDEWNPQCDINDDMRVNVFDLSIAGKNYGKTTE